MLHDGYMAVANLAVGYTAAGDTSGTITSLVVLWLLGETLVAHNN